ncbi:MAG: GAF domain-containing protein [Candidatus Krumholzibacteria bacterium]|nr:GAF domain-containing protein [Candidatus Krumholzibacteria bacterium]
MKAARQVAILGGGEEELNILSELHRDPAIEIVGIYDRDRRAVAIEIAEIIGVPVFTDRSFVEAFKTADHVIIAGSRSAFGEEIRLLRREGVRLMTPSESASRAVERQPAGTTDEKPLPWPQHLEQALSYIDRITDRERLLKWLLEISVRAVQASSGSIMLLSEQTKELYIGYAMGLSEEVVSGTRQKIGTGIAGSVASAGKARLIRNLVETPLYRDGRERESILSAISVPMIDTGVLVGVLNISTDRGDRELEEPDLETITLLAAKIAPILRHHLHIDTQKVRDAEYRIRNHIESLFHTDTGFHEKFAFLSRALAEVLSAASVTVYTATDEGDWLILGGSDHQIHDDGTPAPRIHCANGSLARSFLQQEEVLMTEVRHEVGLKLSERKDAITSFYMPLEHDRPLGVAVIEFANLDAFERFLKLKDVLRFQLGFFVYTQLKELRQSRRMQSLEFLSTITPALMGTWSLQARLRQVPALLSTLVGASMGSFHWSGPEGVETAYHGFPEDENQRTARLACDAEMLARVRERGEPECVSYLSGAIGAYDSPPLYRSIIMFPMKRSGKVIAWFIGYDRRPVSPLDSSVFGSHELELLHRTEEIVIPILERERTGSGTETGSVSFDELLRSNQKILLERMNEEIERAERYHHGFIVTLFRISGLKEMMESDYHRTLDLINELSTGIREQVRKTDYFSWIETDLFAVISLESHNRIEYLEKRLIGFIEKALRGHDLYDERSIRPTSAFAVFPGSCDSAADLIREARRRL